MRSLIAVLVVVLLVAVSFVSAQTCSGTTIYSNSYGVIQDHTGATNYTKTSTTCSWILRPPTGGESNQVALMFDYFDSWGNVNRNQFDFLLIKDGDGFSSPDLVWFYGQTTPPPVLSSGNTFTLIWYVGNWPNSYTGRGFSLQYSNSYCPAQCNWQNNNGFCWNGTCQCDGGWTGLDCGTPTCADGCGDTRGTCSGNRCLCKPGFYGGDCSSPTCDRLTVFTDSSVSSFSDHIASLQGGKKTYDHAANCSWLIQPSGASLIRLSFGSFDLETNWDFLYIYDGPTTDSPKLRTLTGTSLPGEIVSSGGTMLLVFVTDTGVASTGFTASYTSVSSGGSGSALGYLATAFVCLVLGALIGVFGYIFYNKWQQKKSDVHYGSVPTSDDGDLLGDDI